MHRDVKGANILISDNGILKLTDFGVATYNTEDHTQSFTGTPYWMSPEAIETADKVNTARDIWGLGCTIIELLTGKPPHSDKNQFTAMVTIVHEEMPLP